jgi:hypothetical protein
LALHNWAIKIPSSVEDFENFLEKLRISEYFESSVKIIKKRNILNVNNLIKIIASDPVLLAWNLDCKKSLKGTRFTDLVCAAMGKEDNDDLIIKELQQKWRSLAATAKNRIGGEK